MASRERAIVNNLNERSRFYGLGDQLTIEDVRQVLAFYSHTCLNCGTKPATSIDHVKPLASGGQNKLENLQLLCVECNKAKGDAEIDYRQGKIAAKGEPAEVSERSHDWNAIRLDYVNGQISYADLAKKHGLSRKAVQDRGTKENWVKQRGDYRVAITLELSQKLREEYIDAKTTAARVAHDVISSWLSPFGQPASATDALNAAKLLLLAEGEATERVEYFEKLRQVVLNGELGQAGAAKGIQPTANWLRALAGADSDTPVA